MKHDIGDRVVITDLGMNMPQGLSIFNDSYRYFRKGQILLGTSLGERCKDKIWTVVVGFFNQMTEAYLIRNENMSMELVVDGKGLRDTDTPKDFLTEKDMEI